MILRLHSNLLTPHSLLRNRLDTLCLKQSRTDSLTVGIGPRSADEEFLRFAENSWHVKRVSL